MTEIGAAIGYGMQKFHEAMYALVQPDSLQDRLQSAYASLLLLEPEYHLPKRLRSKFRKLRDEIKRAPNLSNDEAIQLAYQIIEMAREVDKDYWKWEESV